MAGEFGICRLGIARSDRLGEVMLRGEIRYVNFGGAQSGEVAKRRPAVLVSNDALNAISAALGRGVITVVPITSNVRKVYPFQVRLPRKVTGLRIDTKAQAEQIRSISISRIGDRIGRLSAELQEQLDTALRLHLGL